MPTEPTREPFRVELGASAAELEDLFLGHARRNTRSEAWDRVADGLREEVDPDTLVARVGDRVIGAVMVERPRDDTSFSLRNWVIATLLLQHRHGDPPTLPSHVLTTRNDWPWWFVGAWLLSRIVVEPGPDAPACARALCAAAVDRARAAGARAVVARHPPGFVEDELKALGFEPVLDHLSDRPGILAARVSALRLGARFDGPLRHSRGPVAEAWALRRKYLIGGAALAGAGLLGLRATEVHDWVVVIGVLVLAALLLPVSNDLAWRRSRAPKS